MSMFKRQVVMLPTNEKAPVIGMIATTSTNTLSLVDKGLVDMYHFHQQFGDFAPVKPYQHLYFLSDDKINEGDYYHYLDSNTIKQCTNYQQVHLINIAHDSNNYKKVVATTDSSLKIEVLLHRNASAEGIHYYSLPQPSEAFINKYIEEYNKSNILTEVLVEYEVVEEAPKMAFSHYTEEELRDFVDHPPKWIEKEILKVDKDNTIAIKK